MFFFTESSKVARVEQLGIKITRMYVFICDSCRSQRVKVASHLLMAEACARLFSSSGNTSSVCVCVCVCVCVRVRVCVCACVRASTHTRATSSSHPASSALAVLFCFISLLSLSAQEANTDSLCSLRSSFRSRGSGGWDNVVQECQAPSRKPGFYFISLLNRSRFLFPCLGCKQPPSPLSFLHAIFHGIHVGWEQRQCVWRLCVCCPILAALCRKPVQTAPPHSCLPFVLQDLVEGLE